MANLLNIAGGIGKGYVEGDQDNQRRAEFNYMQNQRQRQIKQQALDDALTEQLKSVRPAGSYDDYDSSPDAGEEGPPSIAKKTGTKTTITAADADRARANIMARSGRLQDIQAAGTLRQNAYQSEAADRATRQAQAQEVLGNAGQQLAAGDHVGAIRTMQQGLVNSQHPDGHQIVIENRDGVPHVGVAGPDGRYTQQPVPATPEAAKAMLNQGYAMLNQDAHFKAQELGIHQQTANATTAQAAAAQQRAATEASKVYDEVYGRTGDANYAFKMSEVTKNNAISNWNNIRGTIDKNASKQTAAEKAQDLIDTYTPIIMQANPGMPIEQARIQAAKVAMRDPNAKSIPDTGLAEQGMFRVNGKLYKTGQKGNIEEVLLPGDVQTMANDMAKNLPPKDKGGSKAATTPAAPKAKSGADLVPPQYLGGQADKRVNPAYAAFVAKYGLPPTPSTGSRGTSRVNPDYAAWIERVTKGQ